MNPYLITKEEYDTFLIDNHLEESSNCNDKFYEWNFEGSQYVIYLTTPLLCYCDGMYTSNNDNYDEIVKNATAWYIYLGQNMLINEESEQSPRTFVYMFLLNNRIVVS